MQRLGVGISPAQTNLPHKACQWGEKSDTIAGSERKARRNLSTFFHISNVAANCSGRGESFGEQQ
jgi:hypothetical protein